MHCHFCDGIGEPRSFIEEGIRKGFSVLGFSGHSPVPFNNHWAMRDDDVPKYFEAIEMLKRVYAHDIEIYAGLEIDYLDEDKRKAFSRYNSDYVIGSIHYLRGADGNYFSIDESKESFERALNILYDGNVNILVEAYYSNIVKMISENSLEIVGHLDIVKKYNHKNIYFVEDEDWYRQIIDSTLRVIKKKNVIVEVNTGGMTRGFIEDTYPSEWILIKCKEMGIPIILNSDAHYKEDLNGYFETTIAMLKRIGHFKQKILKDNLWVMVEL